METVKIDTYHDLPEGFTGIAECPDGEKQWRLNGKIHRTDGPAVEYSDGEKWWYLDGKYVYGFDGEYIVIGEGLLSDVEWLGEKVPTLKILTSEGFKYIPKLPGI